MSVSTEGKYPSELHDFSFKVEDENKVPDKKNESCSQKHGTIALPAILHTF